MTNAVMNLDSVVSFYRDVPITNTMVPIYRNSVDQFNDWNRFRWGHFTNALYLDHSVGSMTVRVDANKNIYSTDWVSFKNPNFENQRFYARVTEIKQVTSGVVELSFAVDHFQTWMFQFRMRDSHIERQHMSQPQWDRAVANPFRNDIQELTTDEGVTINSNDEVPYKMPGGAWTTSKRYSGPGAITPGVITGPRLEPSGYSGLTKIIGDGSDEPVNKSTDYVIMLYTDNPSYGSGSKRPKSPYTIFCNYMRDGSGEDDKSWGEIRQFSGAIEYDGYKVGIVYPGGQNSLAVRKLKSKYGGCKTPINWHQVLTTSIANETTGSTLMIEGFYTVPESFVLSMVYHDELGEAFFPALFDLLRDYETVESLPVIDYNDIPGYGAVRNPKLRRAPFRHVRLTSPKGEDKQFMIEKFAGNNPKFMKAFYSPGQPEFAVMPHNYNGSSNNELERLSVTGFSQVGWQNDGFSDYVKQMNREALVGETQSGKRARDITNTGQRDGGFWDQSLFGTIQKVGEFIGKGMDTVKGTLSGNPQQGIEDALDRDYDRRRLQQAEEAFSSGNAMGGKGDEYGGVYSHQRSAFIGQGEFHPGRGSSFPYITKTYYFTATLVTLQPYIIHGLDDFLDSYGYRCDYYAIPRVYDYLHSANEDPHFAVSYGKYFTYVKTNGCNIYGVNSTAANAIASLFDGGVKFLRGLQ